MDWNALAVDRDRWRFLVISVMKHRILYNPVEFRD
jgi:hypothetical protein